MSRSALADAAVATPPQPPLRVVDGGGSDAAAGPGGSPAATEARRSLRGLAERRLEIPPYELAAALALERELGISHVLAQILVRRGFADVAAARSFLAAGDGHPPGAFTGIERAVAVIEGHVRDGSRITVHGDYDVDGVCATAILVRALRTLGASVDWFLPDRLTDGYGLSARTVERLAARGTRLLVTADCAITAVDEVNHARGLGIEVVVSDHHHPRPDGRLPDCPIVHPEVCGYPCPDLCGTAVAYKLAESLGAATVKDELELVALATVADLMPLQGENRRLVREGLVALARTSRPGLRALMQSARVDPSSLDVQTLGYRLAPRINAAGRVARADAGLELLLTGDGARAAEIAAELELVNAERRAIEERIGWEADAQVRELGERPAYVLEAEGWHPGVIGIVASRIVERYHRPAVLIAAGADGIGQGSGRSIPGFDLLAGLHACAGHLERYGGHRAAAGMTVRRERVEAFRVAFEGYAREALTPEMLVPVERVDAVVCGSQLGLELAEELERLEPSGIGNPRCRLLIPGGRFSDCRPMGEGRHARFTVTAGGARSPAVAFGCDGRLPAASGQPVDATFRLERNCWNGRVEPRLVLRSAWECDPAAIVVLGEDGEYLAAALEEARREPVDASAAPAPDAPRRDPAPAHRPSPPGRIRLDRRGESQLTVLADALAAGGEVLAVCCEVARRLDGLAARTGGFALISFHGLARDPSIAGRFDHIVALDPPARGEHAALLEVGAGFTHLAWGEPELRFAQQMHELEYALRTPLVALYRALRERQRVAGEELERLLRGDGPHGRPARLAGRLIRVLAELELVSLDPELPALAIAGVTPTALDRSPSYRAYAQTHEDGRRFLSNQADPRPGG
jgi:single-stranded-DNA-specific exonuclease